MATCIAIGSTSILNPILQLQYYIHTLDIAAGMSLRVYAYAYLQAFVIQHFVIVSLSMNILFQYSKDIHYIQWY